IMVPIIIYAGWQIFSNITNNNKIEEQLSNEYKSVMLEDVINSAVNLTFYPKDWRGWQDAQYIQLESGKKYFIWIRKNLTSEDIYFGKIIKRGALLKKNADSDTLTVCINNTEYQYIIHIGD
ncbi:MAG: hypothetical protein ABIJ16_05285, partial [Bacteroidota bacterium]